MAVVVEFGAREQTDQDEAATLREWADSIDDVASLARLGLLVAALVSGKSNKVLKSGRVAVGQELEMLMRLKAEAMACCRKKSSIIGDLIAQLEKLIAEENIKVFPMCEQYKRKPESDEADE